jgi:hypothetical protein
MFDQLNLGLSQRWNKRRDSWKPSGEIFDPKRYGVELLEHAPAKAFVETHHYSGTYPAARLRAGLFETGGKLVGVAVFSVPMNACTIPKYFGVQQSLGVELGRFVLLDEVPGNAETWFLARAFKLLRKEKTDVKGVVSYSDPFPRRSDEGVVVTPGHCGGIYQAHNGVFVGRAKAETLYRTADYRIVSRRTRSKIRNDEKGADYAYRQLLSYGAPPRKPFESGVEYETRALREGPFKRVRHPGNFVYCWSLDGQTQPLLPALPYPKKRDIAA